MKPFLPRSFYFAIVLLPVLLAGCDSKGRNLPLDKTMARDSLVVFLDTWIGNRPVKGLQDRTPPIVGLDDDWDAGKKLESYEIINLDKDDGSNVYAVVKLKFASAGGESKSRQVTYIIGTSPVVSIFRD